jgi:mono/diheme cytochrome c family protein
VTEIPEHLLKRSKERRAAMGLPGGEGDAESAGTPAPASSVPAVSGGAPPAEPPAATPPTPAPTPPPRPLPDFVVAAKTRRRIPFWAMPVLAALPIWLFIYAEAMQPPPQKLTGPLAEGEQVFSNCSSCHGAGGVGGGAGPKLADGEVLKSFPKFEQQYSFVTTGSQPYVGKPYGSGVKTGVAGMPSWKVQGLTADQIMGVVCHERFTLAGLTAATIPPDRLTEFNTYCAPDAPEFVKAQTEGAKYPLYANPPNVAAG